MLIKIYGHEVDEFYNRSQEAKIYKMLALQSLSSECTQRALFKSEK